MSNLYELLGLEPSASEADIRRNFKQLAMRYHPDRNPGNAQAEENFKKVNAAYQILSDPEKKAKYDLILYFGEQSNASVQTDVSSPNSSGRFRDPYYRRKTEQATTPSKMSTPTPRWVSVHTRFSPLYALGLVAILLVFGVYFLVFMDGVAAKIWAEKGFEAYQVGNYAAASSFANDALEKAPELPQAHFLLGMILLEKRNIPKRAFKYLNDAISFSEAPPSNYYFLRGKAALQISRKQQALNDFQNTIHLNPLNYKAHFHLAQLYLFDFFNHQKALSHYKIAEHEISLLPEITFGKAVSLYRSAEYEASLDLLIPMFTKQPDNPLPFFYAALNEIRLGQDTLRACSWLEKSWELGEYEAITIIEKVCKPESLLIDSLPFP